VLLVQDKAFVEAEPLLRACLANLEKMQPEAWTTFHIQSLLGGALLGRKNFEQAEPLLVEGYEGMKRREKSIRPEDAIHIPEALERLIELYVALDKPDQVAKRQAERAKYFKTKTAEKK
jgi:eukaryotic-like serine/threonine-protein kinase